MDNEDYKTLSKIIKEKYESDLNALKKEVISAKDKAYKELGK